jgi:RNA polymerase sigma-70 factor, ECF subfamily
MDRPRRDNPNGTTARSDASVNVSDVHSPDADATDDHLITLFHREALPSFESLFRHALRLTRDHADAQALFRDTLVKAYAGFRTRTTDTDFNTWVCQIMTISYIGSHPEKHAVRCGAAANTPTMQRLRTPPDPDRGDRAQRDRPCR